MTRPAATEVKPTGYCLACGVPLLPGLHFCGPACATEWANMGAAYATATADGIRVEETDSDGKTVRTFVYPYY